MVLLVLLSIPPGAFGQTGPAPTGGRASPDLAVVAGSYGIAPSPPRLQDILTVNVTVFNQGDADAGAFTVAFYLNNTSRPLNSANYRVRVNSLAQGATANVTCTWDTRTSETVYFLSGINYTIIVLVDSLGEIAELSEANNRLDQNQTLGPERAPDLKLVRFTVSPPSPVRGDVVRVNATITNHGEVPGKTFKVYLYVNNITSIISSVDVGLLDLSAEMNVTLNWSTSTYAPGQYKLLVYVNPEFYYNRVTELSWSDNNGSRDIYLASPGQRLELLSFEHAPAQPHVGDMLTVNCTIQNNGSFPEHVTIRIILDDKDIYNMTVDMGVGEGSSPAAEVDTSSYAEGDHTIRVTAGNIDQQDNFTLLPMRRADLVPQNVSFLPMRPKVGESIQINLEVADRGEAAANPSDLSLFLDYILNPVAGASIPQLGPGEVKIVSLSWNTTGITAGAHRLRLQADSGYVVAESNESNNYYSWSVDIGGDIDLAMENLTVRPPSPRLGETVQFSVRVRNIGTLSSASSSLTLKVESQTVDSKVLGPLDPAGKLDTSLRWSTAGLVPGGYHYELSVAPIGDNPDRNTGNNLLAADLEVLAPPPGPDLIVRRILLPEQTPRVGDLMTIGVQVENIGNEDAAPCTMMIFLENGTALLRFTDTPAVLPAVPAGMSFTINVTRDTRSYRAGTYTVNVTVDYSNEVHELNESNNRLSSQVEMLAPLPKTPSVKVLDVLIEGKLEKGSQLNIVAVVANVGEGDAFNLTVRFIIDGITVGNGTIDQVRSGANRTAALLWKSTPGNHTVLVRVEGEDISPVTGPQRQLSIAQPPATAKDGTDPMMVGAALVIIILAVVAVAGYLLFRRGKGPSADRPDSYVEREQAPLSEQDGAPYGDGEAR